MPYTVDPNANQIGTLQTMKEAIVGTRVVKTAVNAIPVSASNVTNLDCSKGDVWSYVPTETTTINAANLAPGQRVTIQFLTSGVTPFVVTFGTGFKSSGTLSSGVTDAKYFSISFTANAAGTLLVEDSRTAAL